MGGGLRILLSEQVVDKAASLALGCCVAGGLIVSGPAVSAGLSLAAVLTAFGLQKLFKDKPECEKALKRVKADMARQLFCEGEALEAEIKAALEAFDVALVPQDVFTADALHEALQAEARVVPALTAHVLADMARRDARFAPDAGMARDLAERILETAFASAADACPPFKGRANLVLAEVTLDEVRGLGAQLTSVENKVDAGNEKLDQILAFLGQSGLARAEAAGLNEAQVTTILAAFAHEGVSADQAEAQLLGSARELTELRARLLRFTNADPATAELKHQAAAAIQTGDIVRARDLVLRAAERHRRAGEELADALKMHRLSEAEALAEAAGMELSLSRLLDAAALYAQAAVTAAPFDSGAAWAHYIHQASALQKHSDLFPGLDRLREAVTVLRDRALPLTSEVDTPTDWATTQNNLGNALRILGERARGEAGLAARNDAAAAFEAALRVYTERDMPAQWATTQNNLGVALQTLGERAGGEAGLAALNDAVTAYRAALRVYTERDMPAQWAMTQHNLGNALQTIGERAGGEAGLAALNDAVTDYRAALRARTERDMPVQWATTTANLCLVQESRSQITRDPAPVCGAVGKLGRVIAVFEAMQADTYVGIARRNRAGMATLCRDLGGTCAD